MTAGVAPEPAGPGRKREASSLGLPSGHPLQGDLFGSSGAQGDVWGFWWSPAGRLRVRTSAGVVTPAERCHGSIS
jgi:hypothetical protein